MLCNCPKISLTILTLSRCRTQFRNHWVTFSSFAPLGRGCELFTGCSPSYTKTQWKCHFPCKTPSIRYLNKEHTPHSLREGEAGGRGMSCPVTSEGSS